MIYVRLQALPIFSVKSHPWKATLASPWRPTVEYDGKVWMMYTQRLQCSSSLVMTYSLLRDYNILPSKELHWSPWTTTPAVWVTLRFSRF